MDLSTSVLGEHTHSLTNTHTHTHTHRDKEQVVTVWGPGEMLLPGNSNTCVTAVTAVSEIIVKWKCFACGKMDDTLSLSLSLSLSLFLSHTHTHTHTAWMCTIHVYYCQSRQQSISEVLLRKMRLFSAGKWQVVSLWICQIFFNAILELFICVCVCVCVRKSMLF